MHVVDAAAEVLCQMSLCAQAPDQVDVLAWNLAFPAHVHMVVALEALVTGESEQDVLFPYMVIRPVSTFLYLRICSFFVLSNRTTCCIGGAKNERVLKKTTCQFVFLVLAEQYW